jgi:hypothetical protein
LVNSHRIFGVPCCLHLENTRSPEASSSPSYALKNEAVTSSETSLAIYQSIWRHIPEDFNLCSHWDSIPDLLARSQSLHRLRHPGCPIMQSSYEIPHSILCRLFIFLKVTSAKYKMHEMFCTTANLDQTISVLPAERDVGTGRIQIMLQ